MYLPVCHCSQHCSRHANMQSNNPNNSKNAYNPLCLNELFVAPENINKHIKSTKVQTGSIISYWVLRMQWWCKATSPNQSSQWVSFKSDDFVFTPLGPFIKSNCEHKCVQCEHSVIRTEMHCRCENTRSLTFTLLRSAFCFHQLLRKNNCNI